MIACAPMIMTGFVLVCHMAVPTCCATDGQSAFVCTYCLRRVHLPETSTTTFRSRLVTTMVQSWRSLSMILCLATVWLSAASVLVQVSVRDFASQVPVIGSRCMASAESKYQHR